MDVPARSVHHDAAFFFFSSRRRHTRLQGDWSSDVCSSDLLSPRLQGLDRPAAGRLPAGPASRPLIFFANHFETIGDWWLKARWPHCPWTLPLRQGTPPRQRGRSTEEIGRAHG